MRILVCINYGRALAGAAITRLTTRAPAMISRACARAGPGVATPLYIYVYIYIYIYSIVANNNTES